MNEWWSEGPPRASLKSWQAWAHPGPPHRGGGRVTLLTDAHWNTGSGSSCSSPLFVFVAQNVGKICVYC